MHAMSRKGCVDGSDVLCARLPAEPYQLQLHPHAKASLEECRRAFGGRLVLYSNSAGLQQFDPDG